MQTAAETAMALALTRKDMTGLLVNPRFEGASISVISVRAGGFEPPRCRHQQDLNLPRMPFRHARQRQREAGLCHGTALAPTSARSRATWPVALTPYKAFSMAPFASTTN